MNSLLEEVLFNYEIQHPQVEFIRHNENETYKIKDMLSNEEFVLRIHKPSKDFSQDIFGGDKRSIDFLKSEISIINGIKINTEVPTQIPVRNKYGEFVTILSDGTPSTILTWVSGKTIDKIELKDDILFKIGEMVGKFHKFSKNWSDGNKLSRNSYDKMLLRRASFKIIEGVGMRILSSEQFKIIEDAINGVGTCIDELEAKKEPKGIGHCDLGKSNLIINDRGEIIPIDFGLSGLSYYYMDLGSLFSHFNNSKQQRLILAGYKGIIHEKIEVKYIEAFMIFQIILYISTHVDNAKKYDWFNSAIDRWSKEFFIPFVNKEIFLKDI